ncbi:hypothetical protein NMY22_g15620 [Coprinellus aureogranulatus]|nr:hypothetical protein NMY22_g15620 [Coprinellus aureogranulatus]
MNIGRAPGSPSPSADDVWRAIQDHLSARHCRFALRATTRSEILNPQIFIAGFGEIALPLNEGQLAVLKHWCQRRPGEPGIQFPGCAERVTTSGEWDKYVSRTVYNVAECLGIPLDGIHYSLCRLIVEQGCDPDRSDRALAAEGVAATVTFYLPTPPLTGGQIRLAHDGETLPVDFSSDKPTITIVASYTDVEQQLDPIWTGGAHRMALVYGIQVPTHTPWPSAERLFARRSLIKLVMGWWNAWKDYGGPKALVHVLQNRSDELRDWMGDAECSGSGFHIEKLTGVDGVVARCIYPIAKDLGIGMYICGLMCTDKLAASGDVSRNIELTDLVRVVDGSVNAGEGPEDRLGHPLGFGVSQDVHFMPSGDPFSGVEPDFVDAVDGANVYERSVLILK